MQTKRGHTSRVRTNIQGLLVTDAVPCGQDPEQVGLRPRNSPISLSTFVKADGRTPRTVPAAVAAHWTVTGLCWRDIRYSQDRTVHGRSTAVS